MIFRWTITLLTVALCVGCADIRPKDPVGRAGHDRLVVDRSPRNACIQ